MIELSFEEAFEKANKLVSNNIDKILDKNSCSTSKRIIEAMRYSSLAYSKKIRSFLTIISANIFGVEISFSLNVATAIELIHTYSLIHDDLPAMDDDDYRRNQQSCHKKFDEATAILAGDALLTFAFELISSDYTPLNPSIKVKLINILAQSIGFNGMAGGQMLDLEIHNNEPNSEDIAKIHTLKTGKLFVASVQAGTIIANINAKRTRDLNLYAQDIGLLFQIKDDLLDHDFTKKSKKKFNSLSIVEKLGIETTKKQMNLLYDQSLIHLNNFGNEANLLRELVKFIIERNN